MAFLCEYSIAMPLPEDHFAILRRRLSESPFEQILLWDGRDSISVEERPVRGVWDAKTASEDIRIIWDEAISMIWVCNYVQPAKPLRVRYAHTRACLFEAIQSFGNPSRFTVLMGELST